LGPLGTAATNRPIVPAPGDYDDGEIVGIKIHLQLSDDTVWKRGAICESKQNCYGARRTKSTFMLRRTYIPP
jgi:hypothetical protein